MAKFLTTSPRYIAGTYHHASPEHPAIIELPEGVKPDRQLIPVNERGEPEGYAPPKPHYAKKVGSVVPAASEHFGPKAPKGPKAQKSPKKPATPDVNERGEPEATDGDKDGASEETPI